MSKEGTPKTVRATADRIIDRAKSAGEKVGRLGDTANSIAEKVRSGSEKSVSAVGDMADKASDFGKRGISAATDVASRSGTAVRSKTTQAVDAVSKSAERARQHAGPTARKIAESVHGQSVEKLTQTAEVVAEGAGSVGKRIREVTGDAADQVAQTTRDATESVTESVTEAAHWTSQTAKQVGAKTSEVATQASGSVADAIARSYRMSEPAARKWAESVRVFATHIELAVQGALASKLSSYLDDVLKELVKGKPTAFCKAMDAEYAKTHIGGNLHRFFDGGHTIWGAVRAGKGVEGDYSITERFLGVALGLLRDLPTPKGLPFFTWDPSTFYAVRAFLNDNFGISKQWFEDFLRYDPAEVLGALGGGLALVYRWNKADSKEFARIVGGTGLVTVFNANLMLGVVMVAALAKAFAEGRADGAHEDAIKGVLQGTAGTGAAMAAVPLITAAGGPAGLALIVSLGAGIAASHLAGKAGEKVDLEATGVALAKVYKSAAANTATFMRTQLDVARQGIRT